jgi:hypothetical protein
MGMGRGENSMKRTSSGLYRASNVTFNLETIEAYSYAWWLFVTKHKGFVVFNDYKYSTTTARHQFKVRSLMAQLGIKVDIHVETRSSLNSIEGRALIERLLKDERAA